MANDSKNREHFPAAAHLYGNGDGVHRRQHMDSGRINFTGLADHDAFTADARLRSELYEVVRQIGEPLRSATRASPVPAAHCR